MALNIMKGSDKFKYLFDLNSYKDYQPNEEQFNDIKKTYLDHEKYFASIKKSMQNKEAYTSICEKEPHRTSPFCDLDNSIRAGYKILLDIKDQLEEGSSKKEFKIWIVLARWLNFERWFSL